jgi:hypothetical protein
MLIISSNTFIRGDKYIINLLKRINIMNIIKAKELICDVN